MHTCVQSNYRDGGQPSVLRPAADRQHYPWPQRTGCMASSDLDGMDEFLRSYICCTSRSHQRDISPEVTWPAHLTHDLYGKEYSNMDFRYARRTLRILKQLSKRGTAWPTSCAQAVEHLLAALGKRKSQPGEMDTSMLSTRAVHEAHAQSSAKTSHFHDHQSNMTANSPQNVVPTQQTSINRSTRGTQEPGNEHSDGP